MKRRQFYKIKHILIYGHISPALGLEPPTDGHEFHNFGKGLSETADA